MASRVGKLHKPSLNSATAAHVAKKHRSRWKGSDTRYDHSPFLPLKKLSSRKKGAEAEHILSEHMTKAGHTVKKARCSDYDRVVNGLRVEVKSSFLWAGADSFRWQQIRADQAYDYIVFMAFYPDRVEFWAATSADVKKFLQTQDANGFWQHNQHGGKTVDSGTYFIDGLPEQFPWMVPLSEFMKNLPTPPTGQNL